MNEITNWSVLKFGGSSVAEARHWKTIVELTTAKLKLGKKPLLVLSALKNVSNVLEALLHQSIVGVYSIAIQRLQELHYGFASELGLEGELLLAKRFEQLSKLCEQIYIKQKITPREHASVLVYGELFSTILGAAYLNKCLLDTEWIDARELLLSNSKLTVNDAIEEDLWHHYLSAECDYSFNNELSQKLANKGDVIVTQGFIARDERGESLLLGREGSDTSASYLAAILNADEIEIWTDVAGFYSTNPRELAKAKQLTHLSYEQARRMASYGAKILHPRAIKPAQQNNIPILVKCISDVKNTGTLISDEVAREITGVFSLVVENPITLIEYFENISQSRNLLKGLGYDIFIETEETLVLGFRNSNQPEPSVEQLVNLITFNQTQKQLRITHQLGMLTLLGRAKGAWLKKVEQTLFKVNLFSINKKLSSPDDGRISLMIPSNEIHKALEILHGIFIHDSDCPFCSGIIK